MGTHHFQQTLLFRKVFKSFSMIVLASLNHPVMFLAMVVVHAQRGDEDEISGLTNGEVAKLIQLLVIQ